MISKKGKVKSMHVHVHFVVRDKTGCCIRVRSSDARHLEINVVGL